DEAGPALIDRRANARAFAQILEILARKRAVANKGVEARFRRQRQSVHLGTKVRQPQRKPGPLEARMPRYQYSPASEVIAERHASLYQTFHGATPLSQRRF